VRGVLSAVSVACFLLTGCGYVGPVLPPSPQLPTPIVNLTAIERAGKILIDFQMPLRTTDGLAITRFSQIDLRIGPAATPFDFDRWAAAAKQYPVVLPPRGDKDDPQALPISQSIAASDWQGQHVAIAVRTSVKKSDHYSSWSNRIVLDVVPPLSPPVVSAAPTANGVLLKWQTPAENQSPKLKYRVYRQDPGEAAPAELSTVAEPSFLDSSAQFDTAYKYTVVSTLGLAESLPSEPVAITPVDTFAPSVPVALTALAGPDSIEVSWQRSPESDLAGYYLYRSVNAAPFERQGGLITLPTYSDHNVEHGKTYRYAVSGIDRKNNESEKSSPASVAF